MKLIDGKIVADEGKHIRDVNDVYQPAYIDENGNEVPEHFPYYTKTLYIPSNFTEEMMHQLYVEEDEIVE